MATQEIDQSVGIQVMLMSSGDELTSLWIPTAPQGRYMFSNSRVSRHLVIEARSNVWYVACRYPLAIFHPDGNVSSCELKAGEIIYLLMGDWKGVMFCEELDRDSQTFNNYRLLTKRLSIGRLSDNDIACSSSLVSRHHAAITREGSEWRIEDLNSSNGVYVNGRRISSTNLDVGDAVFISGLRIIMGNGFVSINDGGGRAVVNAGSLQKVDRFQPTSAPVGADAASSAKTPFNRMPRRRLALNAEPIAIDAPPMRLGGDKMPMLLSMGGSIVRGGMAAMMGNVVSLVSSMLLPLVSKGFTENDRREYERRRVESYGAYLSGIERRIADEAKREHDILEANYPGTGTVVADASNRKKLWERRTTDDDFLTVRLGAGSLPLMSEIDYPSTRFEMDRDPLVEKMIAIGEKRYEVAGAPILVSLTENTVCGLVGDGAARLALAQTLLMQVVSLHSYDELKIVVLADEKTLDSMDYLRYIPHVWNEQRDMRFVATTTSEACQVGEYLRRQFGQDLEKPRDLKDILRQRPYYLVLAFDKHLLDSMEVIKDALRNGTSCGMSLITTFDELPKETSVLLTVESSGSATLSYLKDIERNPVEFKPDALNESHVRSCARTLMNTEVRAVKDEASLPDSVTFLEMFGVGRIEDLNPLKRWAESDPSKSLAAPVGVASDGTSFMLDLHEKHDGPHGLIAGMTGSGKSEFILAYVLSMALNYHPDEVAFVLIDYKGGGLAGAFADERQGIHLPHVVGTITNLDGSAIQRALASINSELRRRQRIFNEAKSANNAGTMDIYTYQRLYRQHKVSEPLPHLFIVSDEFAELKQQAPEFMGELISTARIGRSLGVHLILATQRPSGVVNDQILSNTRFRVCLKVQDRSDSMDVLKRPEAAELRQIGRFYLQVGYNELFAIGQSAYSGAPYIPSDQVAERRDETVRMVDTTGQAMSEASPAVRGERSGKSQLVEIVEMLTRLAADMGIKPRQLWEEPLPAALDLDELEAAVGEREEQDHLVALVGQLDDVQNQCRPPLFLDFSTMRNMLIVGSVQGGKSIAMQTMIFSLARRYSPQQVSFYVLDYSNNALADVASLPHCGAVLGSDDEDRLPGFFDLLGDIVDERRKLFEKLGVTSFDDAVRIHQLPLVLVFIDNIVGFSSTKTGKAYYDHLHEFMREGLPFGIKYIVSCSNYSTEVTQRIKQQLRDRIGLQLPDRLSYGDVLGKRCGYTPQALAGRGMIVADDEPMEFQVARIFARLEGLERNQAIEGFCAGIGEKYAGQGHARRLPSIPEAEEYADFAARFEQGRFPLGYAVRDSKPIAIPLRQAPLISVYFGNPAGVKPVWGNLLLAAQREEMDVTVFRAAQGSIFADDGSVQLVEPTKEAARELCQSIVNENLARKAILAEYCDEHGLDITSDDLGTGAVQYLRERSKAKLFIFERFSDLCSCADDETSGGFMRIFEVARKYNMFFMAGFHPKEAAATSALFKAYAQGGLPLLFGGRLNEQALSKAASVRKQANDITDYNRLLVQYREALHELVMPCGEVAVENDPDDCDIFA